MTTHYAVLTKQQRAEFDRDGFVRGFAVCSADEMEQIRREIEEVLLEPGFSGAPTAHRHLDRPIVHQLCAAPAVVDRVACILGPDLLLWHSRFFDKLPGAEAVPWHQDGHFWPIDPDICLSAWIAIDRAHQGNGCMEFIPGSHRERIPHLPVEGAGRFGQRANPEFFDATNKVSIELEPGEFVLFDRWLLHGSPANRSNGRRLGLVARIIPAHVRVDIDKMSPRFPELGVQLIRGSDTARRNRIVPAPRTTAELNDQSRRNTASYAAL